MTTQNYHEGVNHVVHINTDESKSCEDCDFSVGTDNFAELINHYISVHGYKLLHVGQQTSRDSMGNNWQLTVALLGNKVKLAKDGV